MKSQDLKEISTEKLRKKVKVASILLTICLAVAVVSIATAIFTGKPLMFASTGGLIVVCIPMMIGLKKTKEEIAHRNKK